MMMIECFYAQTNYSYEKEHTASKTESHTVSHTPTTYVQALQMQGKVEPWHPEFEVLA